MLWVSGKELTDVQAFTARANPIETYDTIVLKGKLDSADLTYVATHAGGRAVVQNPMFEYVFEKGSVSFGGYGQDGGELTFRFNDGSVKEYGVSHTSSGQRMRKMWDLIELVTGATSKVACTAEEALLHINAMAAVRAVRPDSYAFPEDQVRLDNGMYWVPGLTDKLIDCYERRALPDSI
jgi:hypothetical protein